MIRYVVRPGDTLTSIAQRYGTTVAAIVEANNITNPNLIFVGQVLLIPTEAPETPTPTPPCPSCPPCPPCPPTTPTPPTVPTPPKAPSVTRTFDGVLYTMSLNKAEYRMGEQIRIRFIKKNILSVPLTLTYRTSQRVDFRITRDSMSIWQWSQGQFFTQAISSDTFRPGEEKIYRAVWNQRTDSTLVRPGLYRLTGWNLATPSIRLNLDFRILASA